MKSNKNLPPKINRPIFVQFVRVMKCRYNPSYARVHQRITEWQLWDKWTKKHFGMSKPSLTVNEKPARKLKLVRKHG